MTLTIPDAEIDAFIKNELFTNSSSEYSSHIHKIPYGVAVIKKNIDIKYHMKCQSSQPSQLSRSSR